MNKKILIGCIITVAILIGVSFTSVVGYQSVKPDVKPSPLFTVRTKRAIDEESKEFSCEYMGKGNDINLLIPNRDDKNALIQNVIERIQEMDGETFIRFIGLIISRINQNNPDEEKIVYAFKQLKDNQKIDDITPWPSWNNRRKCTYYPCTIGAWFPGCWIIGIIVTSLILIEFAIAFFISAISPATVCQLGCILTTDC